MTDDLLANAATSTDRFDLWRRILNAHGTSRMAEVGVWHGEFAAAVLDGCPGISTYYLVDPWRPLDDWNKPLNVSAQRFAEAHRAALAAVAFAGTRAVVLRGTTREVADRISDGSLDAVYVDGDHTLRGITIDLVRMLPKLRPGGLLGGDDFVLDPWHHGAAYEPTLVNPFAVHFAEAMELPIVALPFHQFVICNSPGAFSFTNASGVNHSLKFARAESAWRRAMRAAKDRFRSIFAQRSCSEPTHDTTGIPDSRLLQQGKIRG